MTEQRNDLQDLRRDAQLWKPAHVHFLRQCAAHRMAFQACEQPCLWHSSRPSDHLSHLPSHAQAFAVDQEAVSEFFTRKKWEGATKSRHAACLITVRHEISSFPGSPR
jgi:hypothetical protein